MATLALVFTLLVQVATSANLRCVGFIRESPIPANVFIAGTGEEGVTNVLSEGQIAYLNGPGLSTLKPGGVYWAVRPQGTVRGSETEYGVYYRALGRLQVETLETEVAVAVALTACQPMTRGDLVIPEPEISAVEYRGDRSSRLTPYPAQGLRSVIILGKDSLRTMGAGDFCFIGVGKRDGAKPGDRFTIYRAASSFDDRDLEDRQVWHSRKDQNLVDMLRNRQIPPRPVGDLVVVDAGETTAAARIVNSLVEIAPGDIVVRR